jgi:hypothetical protein
MVRPKLQSNFLDFVYLQIFNEAGYFGSYLCFRNPKRKAFSLVNL